MGAYDELTPAQKADVDYQLSGQRAIDNAAARDPAGTPYWMADLPAAVDRLIGPATPQKSDTPATPQPSDAHAHIANSVAEHFLAGFQATPSGLALRGANPDTIPAEHMNLIEKAAFAFGRALGDTPARPKSGPPGALANMLRRSAQDVEGGPPPDAEELAKDAANAHRIALKVSQPAIENVRPSDILSGSWVQNVFRHILSPPMESAPPEDVNPLSADYAGRKR